MRWVSHKPAEACDPAASRTFHSTMIAPAAVNYMSKIVPASHKSNVLTRSVGSEDHVCDLSTARGASIANSDHDLRVVVVLEGAA